MGQLIIDFMRQGKVQMFVCGIFVSLLFSILTIIVDFSCIEKQWRHSSTNNKTYALYGQYPTLLVMSHQEVCVLPSLEFH